MKLRNLLLAATVVAAPLAVAHVASAQPVTGLYVGVGGGYDWEGTQKAKNIYLNGYGANQTGYPGFAHITTHNGWTGFGSVGYGFGNGFRVEVEGDYMENRFDKFKAYPDEATFAHGKEQKYGGFLNGYYDFDVGVPYVFPYIGGGVGYQEVRYQDFEGGNIFLDKNKGSFAYQGIAGLAFPVIPVPGLSFDVEYRFLGLAGSRKFNGAFPVGGVAYPATFKVEHEYTNMVTGGFRYAFGVNPPPPPAPAPAPVVQAPPAPPPAKTYLVFFDWDKYNLTPRAQEIIAQAASDSKTQQVTTISVSGYTDTSGTPRYNQGLSERRAQAVAAQLVTDGVPQSEITTHAYGETHLLVPTGPGVREPQNRRVEIVFQ